MALVVDAGPLIAALLRNEPRHADCSRLLAEANEPRVVPAPVLAEIEYMCRRDREPAAFQSLLGDIARGALEIADLRQADYLRVGELLGAYADLRVGFVDAAVLAVVERIGETKLATLDRRHFGAMRPRHVEALELLPA